MVLGMKPEPFAVTYKACRPKPTCLPTLSHLLVHSVPVALGCLWFPKYTSSSPPPRLRVRVPGCFFCLKHASHDSFFGFQLRDHLFREAFADSLV